MIANRDIYNDIIELDNQCFEKWKSELNKSDNDYLEWIKRDDNTKVSPQDLYMMDKLKEELMDGLTDQAVT